MRRRILAAGVVVALAVWSLVYVTAQGALPVVPGAPNSFGMNTRAAYGCGSNPTVYKVTSLSDANTAGTLRYAMQQTGPRVVIFETSGYIDVASNIQVISPCLTVAGQTAPSPGITLRMAAGGTSDGIIGINARDVLLQHLRIRPGSATCNSGLSMVGTYETGTYERRFHHVVLDHMSLSWGQDENLFIGQTDANGGNSDVTVWRSITAEGLFQAPSSNSCGGGGLANGHGILSEAQHLAVIQHLYANNFERNPQIAGGASNVLLNNIIYGWQGENGLFIFNFDGQPGPWYTTSIGNRYITNAQSSNPGVPGAVVNWYGAAYPDNSQQSTSNQHYKLDNTVANAFGINIVETYNLSGFNPVVTTVPTQAPVPVGYSAIASVDLESYLLPKVGARPLDRDAVDTRIINNVTNRTGVFISQVSDVGGYPTLAVNSRSLTVPANPDTVQVSGYTNLEEWLHGYAVTLEGTPPTPGPVDPGPATGTVTTSATFTGTTGTPVTNYTSGTGGRWVLAPGMTGVLLLTDANRLRSNATTEGSLTLSAGLPLTAQYDVDVDLVIKTLIAGNSYALWGRTLNSAATTGYFVYVDVDSSTANITQVLNGNYVSVAPSCAVTLTPSTTVHFTGRFRNTSQHAIINGTQCTSTADHALTTAGVTGLSTYGPTADSNSTGIHFDNFVVTDVMTATLPSPPRLRLRFSR